MKKEVFVCDECGAERKEANHWFVASTQKEVGGIQLYTWPNSSRSAGVVHLCGQACVHKFVDEFMSK